MSKEKKLKKGKFDKQVIFMMKKKDFNVLKKEAKSSTNGSVSALIRSLIINKKPPKTSITKNENR